MGPAEMMLQYGGVPVGHGVAGGMAVPYYVVEGPVVGPMAGGTAAAARALQGAQQGVPPQGGLLLAGYSQQGPVFMPAGHMVPQQQGGLQLQAAAVAQPAGPYPPAVPLQQWPPPLDAQQMAPGGWGALAGHYVPLGLPGQQPQHDPQQQQQPQHHHHHHHQQHHHQCYQGHRG
jgi:hypothetical protein